MSDVAGVYDITTKTPMGDQQGTLTLVVDGDTVTGTQESPMMGSMAVEEGKVSGNTVTWVSNMTQPMPMKLECSATVNGDSIEGTVKAGAFGEMAVSGTRRA